METWKEYHGYFVSNSGFVIGERYGLMNPVVNKDGYNQCLLVINGVRKNILLHRLVAICFISNPNNYPVINHKDGNKLNNNSSNLEWCTPKMNLHHAINTGLFDNKGESNPKCKHSESAIIGIKNLINSGASSRKIAKQLNISRSTIQHIKKGRTWAHIIVT